MDFEKLIMLIKDLIDKNFWGEITLKFENGKIVLMKEIRTTKY